MSAVSDDAVEAAARTNIHPQSDPSDIERRKMRRALEAAMPHLAATLLASQEAEIAELRVALTEARDRFNRIRRAIYADEMQGLAKQGAVAATTALRPAETGDGQP